jgi:transmembrane sensor
MHTQRCKEPFNRQIVAEACDWLVEFETGDADTQTRDNFDAWLRQSPEHVRAYLELLPIWKHAADTHFARDAGPQSLIAYARTEDKIVPLDGKPGKSTSSKTFLVPRRRLVAAAAVALVTLGAMLIGRALHNRFIYATGIGEQHSVVLPDGSTLELNALSKVRIRFTEQQRIADLIQGQALFRVAKDRARPFIVNINGIHVRVVGTEFDIYRKDAGTIITVLEGRVAVLPRSLLRETSTSLARGQEGATRRHDGDFQGLAQGGDGLNDEVTSPAPGEARVETHTSQEKGPFRGNTQQGRSNGAGGTQSTAIFLSSGEQITIGSSAADIIPEPRRVNLAATTAWTQRRLVFEASSLEEVVQEFNRYNRQQLVIDDRELDALPISAEFSATDSASLIRFLETQPDLQVKETAAEVRISKR